MSKSSSTPANPNYLIPGREGGKPSAAGAGSTHRESGKPQVKTK
ncbi:MULTISPECIES: hypothetical protein [unclassified Bradyrhizobium]|nr:MULTISPECIES: hypothetical protein [unclassified Bradyrhizobium]